MKCLKLFYTVMESCENLVYHEKKIKSSVCVLQEREARQDGGAGVTPVTHEVHGTFVSLVDATAGHKEQLKGILGKIFCSCPQYTSSSTGTQQGFLVVHEGSLQERWTEAIRVTGCRQKADLN